MPKLPLEGIRVLGMTQMWAGPTAEMHLSDWGAEVIKVESLHYLAVGTRGPGPRHPRFAVDVVKGGYAAYYKEGYDEVNGRPWNRSVMFNVHSRNKRSCTLDPMKPLGREMLKRLVQISDIFLESNQPSVMENLNLNYEVISAWNPNIIMASMSGFGQTGPMKYYRSLGAHQEDFMGHTYVRGYIDRDVTANSAIYHGDEASGTTAAFVLVMALHQRKKTGKGMFIDLAQVEATMPQLGDAVMDFTMNERITERFGNRDRHGAVQGCYRCLGEDRWIAITIRTDEEWAAFCRVMGDPDWTRDEKFADPLSRYRNHDELDQRIHEWTSRHDHFALMYMLQNAGVAAGPVEHPDDAYRDPQMRDREFFQTVTHAECGTHSYPGYQYRMSRTPNSFRLPAPCMGEHNEYVFKTLLKLSDEEYAELERDGHVGMDLVPDLQIGKYKAE
ncbi:MAG: CoA transferase [Dehalococcoidia bacterium]|nr:CoA transferase [Dehalococcoidia bacterium]